MGDIIGELMKRKYKSKMFRDLLMMVAKMDGGKKIKIALDKTLLARKIYDAGRLAQANN